MWIQVCMEIVDNQPCGGHISNRDHECCKCFAFMGKSRMEFLPNAVYPDTSKEVFPISYLEGIELENEMLMFTKPAGISMDQHRQNMIPEEYDES